MGTWTVGSVFMCSAFLLFVTLILRPLKSRDLRAFQSAICDLQPAIPNLHLAKSPEHSLKISTNFRSVRSSGIRFLSVRVFGSCFWFVFLVRADCAALMPMNKQKARRFRQFTSSAIHVPNSNSHILSVTHCFFSVRPALFWLSHFPKLLGGLPKEGV